MYKLYTFFDGCNALVLPLQHFCTNPNCIGDEVRRLWRSMKFAANAENIRTKGHKNKRASRHTGMDLRPCALKSMPVCLEALLFLCSFVLMFSALAADK